MRERRPSQTASFVALARALANDGLTTVPGFADPFAKTLLSPGWALAYRRLSRGMRRAPADRRERAVAQLDVIPLRVAAIDAELEAAIAGGARQVVILGAGLDTRAYRMASLAGVPVFEVDHPATQAYKRRRSAALRPVAGSVVFVPVDFERGSLAAGLRGAGFRPEEPTAWLWEGVVMYLTDAAMRGTLDDVARCSAPGSTLLVYYHTPDSSSAERPHPLRRVLLALWSEPQIGLRTPEVMCAEMRRAGFDVRSDGGFAEWAARLHARAPTGHAASVGRLLVATTAGGPA